MLHWIFTHPFEAILVFFGLVSFCDIDFDTDTKAADDEWAAHPMNKEGMNYKE